MATEAPQQLTTNFLNSIVHVVPCLKRVRAVFAGVTVADSARVVILRAVGYGRRAIPVYYFPEADVRMDLLTPGAETRTDQHVGEMHFYDISVGGRSADSAAWAYGEPDNRAEGFEPADAPDLRGYVAFAWNKIDAWFEEDVEVFFHARDPFKRVDCLPSSRHIRVTLGGEVVAESDRPVLLFETGLRTRYYIPKLDVRQDLLRPTASKTNCPYKGSAAYYTAEVNGQAFEDIAWWYPTATPECTGIAGGYIAFYDEKCDVEIDGMLQSKASWSIEPRH